MPDAQVIVVGGGPGGTSTAISLAGQGIEVLLLDRARFPREKACAEYLSPGTVAALDRLGVLAGAAPHGAWQRGMRIVSEGAELELRYADGNRGLGIPRTTLDHLLLQRAAASGVQVEEGVSVAGAIEQDGRATGVRVRTDGDERTITAELVVGADGVHSAIARSLGVEGGARWPRRLGLVAHAAGDGPGEVGVMAVGRDGYCGVASIGAGRASIGMALRAKSAGTTVEAFDDLIASLPAARAALGGARRTSRIRGAAPLTRRATRVAGPGYLLVGDAAAATDPLTGEGVHRALRGGELAAGAAIEALARADRHPVRYHGLRRQAFAAKQRACLVLQALLTTPPLLEHCLRRAARRTQSLELLAGVFGDYVPAEALLRPAAVARLLAP